MFKLLWVSVVMGSLAVAFSPAAAWAQLQLNIGTSTTQQMPGFTASPKKALPPVPTNLLRPISRDTPPEETLDMPLSFMGEQILQAICDAEIDLEQGLSLMPDLSRVHVQQECPAQLDPTASAPAATI